MKRARHGDKMGTGIIEKSKAGIILISFFFASAASGQIVFNSTQDSYTEDFNVAVSSSSPQSWTDNSTLPGWWARVSDSVATQYSVSSGSNGTGGLMAYSPTAPDANGAEAFGMLSTSSAASALLAVQLVNNTATTITAVTVTFTQLQWYGGNGAANDTFAASYRLGGSAPVSGDFIGVSELDMTDFSSGGGRLAEPVTKTVTHTITDLEWVSGESLWIRWIDTDVSGGDAGAGFSSMSISAVPEPATTASIISVLAFAVCLYWKRRRG